MNTEDLPDADFDLLLRQQSEFLNSSSPRSTKHVRKAAPPSSYVKPPSYSKPPAPVRGKGKSEAVAIGRRGTPMQTRDYVGVVDDDDEDDDDNEEAPPLEEHMLQPPLPPFSQQQQKPKQGESKQTVSKGFLNNPPPKFAQKHSTNTKRLNPPTPLTPGASLIGERDNKKDTQPPRPMDVNSVMSVEIKDLSIEECLVSKVNYVAFEAETSGNAKVSKFKLQKMKKQQEQQEQQEQQGDRVVPNDNDDVETTKMSGEVAMGDVLTNAINYSADTGFPSLDLPFGSLTSKTKKTKTKGYASTASASASAPSPSSNYGNSGNEIDDINKRVIEGMTRDDILDEQKELIEKLDPTVLAFIRKRNADKLKKQSSSSSSFLSSSSIPVPVVPAAATALSIPIKGKVYDKTVTPKTEEELIAAVQQLPQSELNKLAWTLPSEDLDVVDHKSGGGKFRMDLDGVLISSQNQNQKLNESESGVVKDDSHLHHHDRPDLKGYTLLDLTTLARSSDLRQRYIAFRALALYFQSDAYQDPPETGSGSGIVDEIKLPRYLPLVLRAGIDQGVTHGTFRAWRVTNFALISLSSILQKLRFNVKNESDEDKTVTLANAEDDDDNDDNGKSKDVEGYTGGAVYKLDDSKSDSLAFQNDPIWTLLSKMAIIPAISNVISKQSQSLSNSSTSQSQSQSQTNTNTIGLQLDVDGLTAVCVILKCLSLRSSGAASAIVEASGVVKGLVFCCLEPESVKHDDSDLDGRGQGQGKDRDDENEDIDDTRTITNDETESNFIVTPTPAIALISLLITLSKSSRHAASTAIMNTALLSTHSILTMQPLNELEYKLQTLCIEFYGVLLGYALALPYLPTYLRLMALHVQIVTPLTMPYIDVLMKFIACVKPLTKPEPGAPNVKLTKKQKDVLLMSGMWIDPVVKICLDNVTRIITTNTTNTNITNSSPIVVGSAEYYTTLNYMSAVLKLSVAFTASSAPSLIHDDEAFISEGSGEFYPALPKSQLLPLIKGLLRFDGISDVIGNVVGKRECVRVEECSVVDGLVKGLVEVALDFEGGEGGLVLEGQGLFGDAVERFVASSSSSSSESTSEATSEATSQSQSQSSELTSSLNKSSHSILHLLTSTPYYLSQPTLSQVVTSYAYIYISHLVQGEEALAASILSIPELISPYISQILLSELHRTNRRRHQLSHSIKLLNVGRMAGRGPYVIESLNATLGVKMNEEDVSLLLPVGKKWLLYLLSSVGMYTSTSNDSGNIVLEIMEYFASVQGQDRFVDSMTIEDVVYHVSVLAQSEVMDNGRVDDAVDGFIEGLLSLGEGGGDGDGVDPLRLIDCIQTHTATATATVQADSKKKSKTKKIDANDLTLFDPEKSQTHYGFASQTCRSYLSFLKDITTHLITTGFTKTGSRLLRLLLSPKLPPTVCAEVFGVLKGNLRNLSVGKYTPIELKNAVESSVKSSASCILDAYADFFVGSLKLGISDRDEYCFKLAVLTLSHDLAASREAGGSRRIAAERRCCEVIGDEEVRGVIEGLARMMVGGEGGIGRVGDVVDFGL